jgi:YTH domain-containing family protein
VKDIPNKNFKHLLNKLNEGKPVTNSRDVQEISFPEGVQMLEIFRDFREKTSIFDDYEALEEIASKNQIGKVKNKPKKPKVS